MSATNENREIEAIMQTWQGPLLRYARRLLCGHDAAQDVVQDAFIRYLQYQANPDKTPVRQVKSWLYQVTHNLALDYIRKNRRHEDAVNEMELRPPKNIPAPDTILARRDTTETAMKTLQILSERDQQVVLLKIMEEKSYREIAEIMELSVSNVGFILHASLKKLATALTAQLDSHAEGKKHA